MIGGVSSRTTAAPPSSAPRWAWPSPASPSSPGYIAGREIAARQPDDDAAQDAARAIWDAVFGGLETLGLVMAGAGALVALIAGVANRVHVPGRE